MEESLQRPAEDDEMPRGEISEGPWKQQQS